MTAGISSSRLRVACDLNPMHGYSRPMLRGILRYVAGAPHLELRGFNLFAIAEGDRSVTRCDGRLVHFLDSMIWRTMEDHGEPRVTITDRPEVYRMPAVAPDNVGAGAMAAEHFLDRGLRHFAFAGPLHIPSCRRRYRGFAERLEREGARVELAPYAKDPEASTRSPMPVDWLLDLPRPCGLLGWNDETGHKAVAAARDAGRAVPDDLAVLGVQNDELVCESVSPGLSSVALPLIDTGYRAAELLDRLMQGEGPPGEPIRLAPIEVVERGSTRMAAVNDATVARALTLIHREAARGLTVDGLCDALDLTMSRRTLERRFLEELGRSPHEEIRRTQIQRARDLLGGSDLPLIDVAARCGFSSQPFFSNTFLKHTGERPGAYRRKCRRR